jgi:hypothetical protein
MPPLDGHGPPGAPPRAASARRPAPTTRATRAPSAAAAGSPTPQTFQERRNTPSSRADRR